MTLPSTLSLTKEGNLIRKPMAALTKLRKQSTTLTRVEVDGSLDLSAHLKSDRLELALDLDPSSATSLTLNLLTSADNTRGIPIRYDCAEKKLTIPGRAPVSLTGKSLKLQIFLDGSVMDVYTDGGAVSLSTVIAPQPQDRGASLDAEGGAATLKSFRAYALR
jgi:sucrose-6-phosphate hydrolase SacC (GH32 family)